jgi:hypothetical protein
VTADPVSWLMIEPGWTVVAAGGDAVGRVDEVIGEPEADIFDGLAVSGGVLTRRRYVPGEVVGEITTGTVRLTVDAARLEELEERVEPPGGSV